MEGKNPKKSVSAEPNLEILAEEDIYLAFLEMGMSELLRPDANRPIAHEHLIGKTLAEFYDQANHHFSLSQAIAPRPGSIRLESAPNLKPQRNSMVLPKPARERHGSFLKKKSTSRESFSRDESTDDEGSSASASRSRTVTPRSSKNDKSYLDMQKVFSKLDELLEEEEKDGQPNDEEALSAGARPSKIVASVKEKISQYKEKRLSKSSAKKPLRDSQNYESNDDSNWQSSCATSEASESESDAELLEVEKTPRGALPPGLSPPTKRPSMNVSSQEPSAAPGGQRRLEERLDMYYMSVLIALEMVALVAGGGPEEYRVIGINTANGPGIGLERLKAVPHFVSLSDNAKMPGLNFLFCTDIMLLPFHPSALKILPKILTHSLIQQWLKICKDSDIELREGLAEDLYMRIKRILHILKKSPTMIMLEVLMTMFPLLRDHYLKAFEYADPLSRKKSLGDAVPLVDAKISSSEQHDKFKKLYYDRQKIPAVKEDLQQGKTDSFFCLDLRVQEFLLYSYKFIKLPENEQLLSAIMVCLTEIKFRVARANLSYLPLPEKFIIGFLEKHAESLVCIKLNASPNVTDKVVEVLQKKCVNLKKVVWRNAKDSVVNLILRALELNLSGMRQIDDSKLQKIALHFQSLRKLKLDDPGLRSVTCRFDNLSHLDLHGCEVGEAIFKELGSNVRYLKFLRINSSKITQINTINLNVLISLDVSGSANLLRIFSQMSDVMSLIDDLDGLDIISYRSKLQVIKANDCAKLQIIDIDTSVLTALYANNCALETVKISPGRPLPALRIIELNNNIVLQALVADPAWLIRLRLLNCKRIDLKRIGLYLTEAYGRRLLDQFKRGAGKSYLPYGSSAATTFFRNIKNPVHFAREDSGAKVFHGVVLPGFDARGANLESGDFSNAVLPNAQFAGANLRNSIFRNANLTGVSFEQMPPFIEHIDSVLALAHNADGSLLVSADKKGMVILRNREKILHTLQLRRPVAALAISADGRRLALAGACAYEEEEDGEDLYEMSSRQDEHLQSGAADIINLTDQFLIYVYDIDPKSQNFCQQIFVNHAHQKEITSLVYTADRKKSLAGNFLISASKDGKIKMFNAETVKANRLIADCADEILSMSLRNNNIHLAYIGGDGKVNIWNINGKCHEPTNPVSLSGSQKNVDRLDKIVATNAVYSPDGKSLITCGPDKKIRIWIVATWQCLEKNILLGHQLAVSCLAVSSDGQWIFSAEGVGNRSHFALIVWNFEKREKWLQIDHDHPILAIDIDPGMIKYEGLDALVIRIATADNQVRRHVFCPGKRYFQPDRNDFKAFFNVRGADFRGAIGLKTEDAELLNKSDAYGAASSVSPSLSLK
jgi:WD40 repeat protein